MVTDSEIISKGSSHDHPASFEVTQKPAADPKIQRLALQMQQAGDALTTQYKGRIEVHGIPVFVQSLI